MADPASRVDPRFIQDGGTAIFTGNELLVKGALETEGGVHLMTGYPGSPIASFFDTIDTLAPLFDTHGICGKIASNEALGMAMVNGAQMAGCRAITAMKSVGVHVASDALALGVLAGTQSVGGSESGGLVILGDDPWSDSTQVPADSRFIAEHVRLPVLEPGTPQEVKDYVDLAFKLGRAGHIYIGYLLTVPMADGGGTVTCRPNHYPTVNQHQKKTLSYLEDIEPKLEDTVLLPPRTGRREEQLPHRLQAVVDKARELGINRIVDGPRKDEKAPLAFVAAGNAYAMLRHALAEMGLLGRIPILKLSLVYPVDTQLVGELARRCEQMVVVEERRSFVERQVLEAVQSMRRRGETTAEVYGKEFPQDITQPDGRPVPGLPSARGLNPSLLIQRLVPLLKHHPTLPIELTNGNLSALLDRIDGTSGVDIDLPTRTPTFCPGCPHRDSSSVLLELRNDLLDPEYMQKHHQRKPVDLVAHGDTGCYTMLMFEPNKPLMHNYSGMGLGGATGAGVDPFIDNKQLVFMGDGTFYHSGQVAISQSIYNGQDLTYVILDNKTTAMTGHQGHAGLELDLTGQVMNPLDIEKIVRGMVPRDMKRDVQVVRINPADRDRYRRLMEQTILAPGVKIVIADKECGITYHRRARREERKEIKETGFVAKKTYMNVATEVCEYCLECTSQTGCPGLKIEDTDYGPKIQTDMSWCVNDGACHRIHACPSFEEVTVVRKQPKRMGDLHVELRDVPAPTPPLHAGQDTWRCHLAGVGGMGIGTAGAILNHAGHLMGYHVAFLDKKGLAIRNGGVYSQIVFTRPPRHRKEDHSNGNGTHTAKPRLSEAKPGVGSTTTPTADAAPLGPSTPRPLDPSPQTTAQIPYGSADLLLGVDLLEAARGLDPRQPYRVASHDRTAAVVNSAKTPTISELMGREGFKPDRLVDDIQRHTRADRFTAFNVGDLCERVLDNKLYANIMMLGIAFQKGLLPLRQDAIEQAIGVIARADKDRNLRAFNIGRKIAVRPDLFVVEPKHEYETARQCLRRKVNTFKLWWGKGKGERTAKQFRVLMKQTFRQTRGLRVPDRLMRDVIIRAYDCVIWGGIPYARRYCDRLVEVFHKDHPQYDYRLTRAVVWNLAKVMLIKDEIYVSALLTSPEKYKRDRRRFNVNPERGDKVIYKHHNRPEFVVAGKKIRFEWKSRDWQLRMMAGMRPLRKYLPGWHQHERDFRDWYENLLDIFDYTSDKDYERWLAILSVPEPVTGYREIRYPKMEAARKKAQRLLDMDPERFEVSKIDNDLADTGRMKLPVLGG